jgi:hypothetical protein
MVIGTANKRTRAGDALRGERVSTFMVFMADAAARASDKGPVKLLCW